MIAIQKAHIINALSILKNISFVEGNSVMCIKFVKNTNVFIVKKNEAVSGKYVSLRYNYVGEQLPEDYLFVSDYTTICDMVAKANSPLLHVDIRPASIIVDNKSYANQRDIKYLYIDVTAPKDFFVNEYQIPVDEHFKNNLRTAMEYTRAVATNEYVRNYDGVVNVKDNYLYSTDGKIMLTQKLTTDVPDGLIVNDLINIILAIPTPLGTKDFIAVRKYELSDEEVTKNHKFYKHVYAFSYKNFTFIHSRTFNEFAPIETIDFTFDTSTYCIETTPYMFTQDIMRNTLTERLTIHTKDFNSKFRGVLYKNEPTDYKVAYAVKVIEKALAIFKHDSKIYVMFKDKNSPLIIYNDKCVVHIAGYKF